MRAAINTNGLERKRAERDGQAYPSSLLDDRTVTKLGPADLGPGQPAAGLPSQDRRGGWPFGLALYGLAAGSVAYVVGRLASEAVGGSGAALSAAILVVVSVGVSVVAGVLSVPLAGPLRRILARRRRTSPR